MLVRDGVRHGGGNDCVWTSCSLSWVLNFTPSALGKRDAILNFVEHCGMQKRRR